MGNMYENVGKMSVLPLQPTIVFFIPLKYWNLSLGHSGFPVLDITNKVLKKVTFTKHTGDVMGKIFGYFMDYLDNQAGSEHEFTSKVIKNP